MADAPFVPSQQGPYHGSILKPDSTTTFNPEDATDFDNEPPLMEGKRGTDWVDGYWIYRNIFTVCLCLVMTVCNAITLYMPWLLLTSYY